MWSQADYILLRENGSKSQLHTWDFENGQNDVKIAAQADGENKNHYAGCGSVLPPSCSPGRGAMPFPSGTAACTALPDEPCPELLWEMIQA